MSQTTDFYETNKQGINKFNVLAHLRFVKWNIEWFMDNKIYSKNTIKHI